MPKKIGLLLSFFLFLLFPLPAIAGSPGLNLINSPGTAGYVPDINTVNSWMTYIPETPDNLNANAGNPSLSATNIILRLHAAWTDTGKEMLGSPSQQYNVATHWCAAIKSFAQGKNVYVEPFNELSHDTERLIPGGASIDLDKGIIKAQDFIGYLSICLSSIPNVTLTSPSLDPHNAGFLTTSQAFSDFNVISYHSYNTDTTHNYNSGVLAGKQFIFSEVGTISGGQVIYDDCALVKHFCGEGISQFLQGQSNILAYTLFTFAPGDYKGGNWKLTNPDVVRALANDCGNLTIDPDTCRIGSSYGPGANDLCSPIQPDSITHEVPVGAPFCPEHPYVNNVKNPPPSNDLCTFRINVSKNFDNPIPVVTGTPPPLPPPLTINEVSQNKNYNNSRLPKIYQFIARLFWENDQEDIFKDKTIHDIGPDVRSSTYNENLARRDLVMMEAVLSLGTSTNLNAFDTQIGWACQGSSGQNWCSKTPLANQLCRPIYISEIAAQGLNEGSQAIKIINARGQIDYLWTSQIDYYEENLEAHYGPVTDGYCRGNPGCLYLQRISREPDVKNVGAIINSTLMSKLDHYCYNHLWEQLPKLQKGSSEMILSVTNIEQGDTEAVEVVEDYSMNVPYSATLINSQNDEYRPKFYNKFLPKTHSQNISPIPSQNCSDPVTPPSTTQDTVYIPSFLARIWKAFMAIILPGKSQTIIEPASARLQTYPEFYEATRDAGELGSFFLPKSEQEEFANSPDSYYIQSPVNNEEDIPLPAPGKPEKLDKARSLFLIPKSQQN